MKVKKYLVKDMQQAIAQIKKDMGPEAIIISQRRVRGKVFWGFFTRRLEVTAALEEGSQTSFSQGLQKELTDSPQELQKVAGGEKEIEVSEAKFSEKIFGRSENKANPNSQVQEELKEMKTLLQQVVMTKESNNAQQEEHLFKSWRQKLLNLDLFEALVEKFLIVIPEEILKEEKLVQTTIINYLISLLEPLYAANQPGQVISFIGPTGVGKTTTLAKLAAQLALNHQKKVAILTIDTYRIGAVEQLRTYAEIIGVPLQVVMSPNELTEALVKNTDRDYILIDTTGRPFTNINQVEELKSFLIEVSRPHDIILVLSSNMKSRDLLQATAYFSPCDYNKLIFTKTDETITLGSILNVVDKAKLPVTYITNGQNVPDDIVPMDAGSLAKLILRGVDL
ncbi:hypothetical protein DK28_0211850 [Peptococcaceae bacterium SCADC1_2_3]|nr:hypothetical protein DK28_0211850 [Peptococcaceae bacterium SCADC1_2_3]KFI35003.1 hypothetical protein HY00_08100 [Peptococcaceae bacterium SCADC1_2_3]